MVSWSKGAIKHIYIIKKMSQSYNVQKVAWCVLNRLDLYVGICTNIKQER